MHNSYDHLKGLLFDLGCEGIQSGDTGAVTCIRPKHDVDMRLGFSFEMSGEVLLITLMLNRDKFPPFDTERIEGLQALVNHLNSSFSMCRWYYNEDYIPGMDMQIVLGGQPVTHRQLAKVFMVVDELARNQVAAVQIWCKADLPLQPGTSDFSSTAISALIARPDLAKEIFESLSFSRDTATVFEELAKALGADFVLPEVKEDEVATTAVSVKPEQKCLLH